MTYETLIEEVYSRVLEKLNEIENYRIPVGVSNRHVHVSEEDFITLFGPDAVLHKKADLKQPGQFAAEEVVTIRGPKGDFERVRILGPLRPQTQVEISLSDSFRLGVKGIVKESGKLTDTPGLELIGPKGKVQLSEGTIVALRHIHMSPDDARRMNVKDGDFVNVQIFGLRKLMLSNVLIRVSPKYQLEMHLDMDEANAGGIKNGDTAILSK
ncbi:MAG: phosphate propanoyltransferase [Veillonella sp.]|uniref:phosphate propanoyltransferase n=1 Tax=Veillonella sp. TaxID=1926307 RepID=UPI0025D70C79|nr:phosphate propanoyltransferase [Veillonella sp.]MBS4913105.1 phosphate propanoyltransferase [Veillonella sp.]